MKTIPLHLLPDEAFSRILQIMKIYEQLAYSLCSKNTKKAIKSLNLEARQINISVADFIEVVIYVQNLSLCWNSMEDFVNFPNIMAHEGIQVSLKRKDDTIINATWDIENLEFKEWLHHFCEVLHHPRIDSFEFYGENMEDNYIEPIQKVIEGLQIRRFGLCSQLTNDFMKKALESFPAYEKLFLDRIPFENQRLQKLLVRNLTSLSFSKIERLKIDQVLVTNSETIKIHRSEFTEKEFNRFLKLWLRGSNPRLKFFDTMGQPENGSVSLNKSLVLKGIKYEQISLDSKEVHRDYLDVFSYFKTKLAGESRIRGFNGNTAVVVVSGSEFQLIVE